MPYKSKVARRKHAARYRRANRERIRGYANAWYRRNSKKVAVKVKQQRRNNPEATLTAERAYRAKNAETIRRRRRRYYKANRDRILAASRKLRQANGAKYYAARRLKLGLPAPTRPMPPHCECCSRTPKGRGMSLDHCHVTNNFRGWLCGACNRAIGMLGDNVRGLERAIFYLRKHGDQ
jgi:hypothetical protein